MPGSHHHDYTPINTDEEAHLSPRSFRGHHRKRTHVPEELERAAAPLREGLERRLPFHQHRWKCVSQPERAGFILGAHARLEVTLVEARGLVPSQGGGFLRHPHPFVRVLLDDTTVHETPHVRASRSPVWDDHCSVDIVAGASMVRFAVNDMDSDKEENAVDMLQMNAGELDVSDRKHAGLGFVEICVEDIPFDQELDGWLELRLAGNLQGNSRDRYLQHCGQREDALHKAMEEQLRRHDVAALGGGDPESHAPPSPSLGGDPALATQQLSVRCRHGGHLRRVRDLVRRGRRGHHAAEEEVMYNAGELHVRMRLVLMEDCDETDRILSLAITPHMTEYNAMIQEENLPEFNVQEAYDDAIDIKMALIDNMVFCVASYIWYLLTWRDPLLSLIIVSTTVFCIAYPEVLSVCFYSLLVFLLVLNASSSRRAAMTTSGLNAPVNESGYQLVARWNSIPQMEAFLVRAVVNYGGHIDSEKDLYEFVARVFRPGVPLVPLDVVLGVLRTMDWVTLAKEGLDPKRGMKVRVGESGRRATIESIEGPTGTGELPTATVVWDQDEALELAKHQATVPVSELSGRMIIPKIPKVMLSGKLKQSLRKVSWQLDAAKKSQVIPACTLIRDVLSWRRCSITVVILACLLCKVALAVMDLLEVNYVGDVTRVLRFLAAHFMSLLLLVGVVLAFLLLARPVRVAAALAHLLLRVARERRGAPGAWAFWTPCGKEPSASPAPLADKGRHWHWGHPSGSHEAHVADSPEAPAAGSPEAFTPLAPARPPSTGSPGGAASSLADDKGAARGTTPKGGPPGGGRRMPRLGCLSSKASGHKRTT